MSCFVKGREHNYLCYEHLKTVDFCFADDSEKVEKTLNGEEKTDSGVEPQNSEVNANDGDPLGPNCYYDKSKSFFDNISCDDSR